ncbi:MAG: hypothetical protein CMP22_00470 [Rickettsiales bacterium]|nr:hypothetical protein [Rickettsiales bacterium]
MPFGLGKQKEITIDVLKDMSKTVSKLYDNDEISVKFNMSHLDIVTNEINKYLKENGLIEDGQELTSKQLIEELFNTLNNDFALENAAKLISKINDLSTLDDIKYDHEHADLSDDQVIDVFFKGKQSDRSIGIVAPFIFPGMIIGGTVGGIVAGQSVLALSGSPDAAFLTGMFAGIFSLFGTVILGFGLAEFANKVLKPADMKSAKKRALEEVIEPRNEKNTMREEAIDEWASGLSTVFEETLAKTTEDDEFLYQGKKEMPAVKVRIDNTKAFKATI